MAVDWISAGGGDFDQGSNWSTGQVPGAGDDAVISVAGITVTMSRPSNAVASLTLGTATTTLQVSGAFTDKAGGSSLGTLSVGGTFAWGSTFTNASGATIAAAGGTLQGDGADSVLVNDGQILAAAGMGLTIDNGVAITNAGGALRADGSGAHIDLAGVTIAGGTLDGDNGAVINDLSAATLDGTASEVTNAGALAVADAATLVVRGTLDNTGLLALNGGAHATSLEIDGGPVTLKGGGTIQLADVASSHNRIFSNVVGGNVFALVNVNDRIVGAGQLGLGQMTFQNKAGGVVNANGVNALILNLGGRTATNTGLLEATGTAVGSGGLVIQNTTVDNTGFGNGGLISAVGANARVHLQSAVVIGGKLSTSGGGLIDTIDSGSVLDGTKAKAPVENTGALLVSGSTALTLKGAIVNSGTITVGSAGAGGQLRIDTAGVTLTGGGTIALSGSTANTVMSVNGVGSLDNRDNTISGAGVIGDANLKITNGGKIYSTSAGLVLTTPGATIANSGVIAAIGGTMTIVQTTVANSGIIYSTGSQVLALNAATIINAGGVVLTNTAGASIALAGSRVTGGHVFNVAGATIATVGGSLPNAIIGAKVENEGMIAVASNSSLQLGGAVKNSGQILLQSVADGVQASLFVDPSGLVLSGGGAVTLTDSNSNAIVAPNGQTAALTNIDNTISGAGQLGGASLTLINQRKGVIDATGADNPLNLQSAGQLFNAGLIEATGAGGLTVNNSAIANSGGTLLSSAGVLTLSTCTVINSVTGTLRAKGAGQVALLNSLIQGGVLATSDAGVILARGVDTLDGTSAVLTNKGQVTIDDGARLRLRGAISNAGTIGFSDTGAGGVLEINASAVTLTGGGSIVLGEGGDIIEGTSAANTLFNVDNTISGDGQIGAGQMSLANGGVIDATSNKMIIDAGRSTIVNSGTLEATGGVLQIKGLDVINTGLIEADGRFVSVSCPLSGTGNCLVTGGPGASLSLGGAVEAGQTVTLGAGTTGRVLFLSRSQKFSGSIAGLSTANTNQIDLKDIAFVQGVTTATYSTKTDVVTVTDGSHTAKLHLLGSYDPGSFSVTSDGSGGTLLADPPAGSDARAPAMAQAMAGLGAAAGAGPPFHFPPAERTASWALIRPP